MAELEDLGSRYPFRIPPFFTLILRAFSVIEGIALAVDPDYAIVQVRLRGAGRSKTPLLCLFGLAPALSVIYARRSRGSGRLACF
jgi:hypothetical protein